MSIELFLGTLGFLYGYQHTGVEDPKAILKKGGKIGLVLVLVLSAYWAYTDPIGSPLASFGTDMVAGLLLVIYLTAIYTAGTVVGDFFEANIKK